jgi:hypothetical protein
VAESTYHKHLISIAAGAHCNYRIDCSCGWSLHLAVRSDLAAVEAAQRHVKAVQPPTIEELFAQLGGTQ